MAVNFDDLVAQGGTPVEGAGDTHPNFDELLAQGTPVTEEDGSPPLTSYSEFRAPGPSFLYKKEAPSPAPAPAFSSQMEHRPVTLPIASTQGVTIPGLVHKGALATAEAGLKLAKAPSELVRGGVSPGEEAVARAFGQGLVGDDFLKFPKEDEGQEELRQKLGPTGAAALQTAASTGATALSFLAPGLGWAEEGAAAARVLPAASSVTKSLLTTGGKLLGAAAEGSVLGGTQAMIQGTSIKEGAKFGAALGTGLTALGGLAGAGSKYMAARKLAKAEPVKVTDLPVENVHQLADEVAQYSAPSKAATKQGAAAGLAGDHPIVDAVEVRPGTKDFEPSFVTIIKRPDGSLWARSVEFKQGQAPRFFDMPMETFDEARAVGNYIGSRNLDYFTTRESLGAMGSRSPGFNKAFETPIMEAAELRPKPTGLPEGQKPLPGEVTLGAQRAKQLARDAYEKAGKFGGGDWSSTPTEVEYGSYTGTRRVADSEEMIRVASRDSAETAATPGRAAQKAAKAEDDFGGLVDFDSPPVDPGNGPVAVFQNPDGSLKLRRQASRYMLEDTHVEPPTYVPSPPEAAKLPPKNPGRGEILYMPSGASYETVKVVGPASKPGEVLVKVTEDGQAIAVKLSSLRSELPPGVASLEQAIPEQVPVPPQPNPANIPPEMMAEANIIKRIGAWMANRGGNPIVKKLMPAHLRGPKDIALMVQMSNGVKALEAINSEALVALRKAIPNGKLLSEVDVDLSRVGEGRISWADFRAKHGDAIADQAEKVTQKFLAERTADDARLAQEFGVVPENYIKERANGSMDAYLARIYMPNLVGPDKWFKYTQKTDLFDNAVQFLVKEVEKSKKFYTPSEIAAELTDILKAGDVEGTVRASKLGSLPSFKRLLSRKDIPEPLKKVMGEVESGVLRLAATFGTQKALLAQHTLMREIAVNPQWSNIGPRPDLHNVPVPNVKRMYGDLAGKYVRPEIYENIINLPKATQNSYAYANAFSSFLKGGQLMSAGPVLTSLAGNIQSIVLAGGIDPLLRPDRAGKYVWRAIKAISNFKKDPTGKTGLGALVLEAKKLGADFAGHAEVEVSPKSRAFVEELEKHLANGRGSYLDYISSIGKWFMSKYRSGQDALLGGALDYPDRVSRLASYLGLKDKLIAKGMAPEAAMRQAAQRVLASFPNPSHMGQLPEQVSKMTGLVAPYSRMAFEEFRILSMVPQRLASEPDLIWRLGANAAVLAGIFGINGALRQQSGITDEMVDYAKKAMTKAHQTYSPMVVVPAWKDDKGRVQMWDVSNYALPLKFMQGHPDAPMWQHVFSNFVKLPAQGGLAEPVVDSTLSAFGLSTPPPDAFKPGTGEAGLLNGLNQMWRQGFGPRIAATAIDAVRKTGAGYDPVSGRGLGRNEEQLTPMQGIAKGMGLPIRQPIEVSPNAPNKEFIASATELKRRLDELMAERMSVGAADMSEIAKARRSTAIEAEIQRLVQEWNTVTEAQQRAYQSQGAMQ